MVLGRVSAALAAAVWAVAATAWADAGAFPKSPERAEVDFFAAAAECSGASDDAARAAHSRCARAMTSYHDAHRGSAAAARRVVQAASTAAKMMQAERDPRAPDWCRRTVAAFERYAAGAPGAVGGPEADLAAECAFAELDERIKAEFDYETGHHRYAGRPDAVLKNFAADLTRAATYAKGLERIARFGSKTWIVAALAREASLYDSCRTGLYNAAPPAVRIHAAPEIVVCFGFPSEEDEQAAAIRQDERARWRVARNARLEVADAPMIQLYTRAFLAARSWQTRSAAVELTLRRLGFFGDILGESKMRGLTLGLEDPATRKPFVYADGMFLRARPALPLVTEVDPLPPPAPLPP